MPNKYEGRPYHVAMFVSRNKDNQNLEGFVQRTRAFLTQKTNVELHDSFVEFSNRGVLNEVSRLYISVNPRKHEVIHKSLQHYLIDQPEVSLVNMEKLVASLAMKKGTALTKKFLFDFDEKPEYIGMFVDEVEQALGNANMIEVHETPNGFAVVTEQGFDTRELLSKWENVELKRDAMLFTDSYQFMG